MKITDIKDYKKKLKSIYIDGEFAFNIYADLISEKGISVGNVIDDDELNELVKQSNERRAKEKALYLLSIKNNTKAELINKLLSVSDRTTAENTVNSLEEVGLINDEDYATCKANDLIYIKHYSKRRVKYELIKKGIDEFLIEEILENIDINPIEQIECIVNAKYKNAHECEKTKRKAISALQRLGFDWEDIKDYFYKYD